MVTVWLGPYVHNPNPQGSCEYDEADMVKKKKEKSKRKTSHRYQIRNPPPELLPGSQLQCRGSAQGWNVSSTTQHYGVAESEDGGNEW